MNNGSSQRTCQAAAILYGIYEPCTRRASGLLGMRLCPNHARQVEEEFRRARPPRKVTQPTVQHRVIADNQRLMTQVSELILEVKQLRAQPPEQRLEAAPQVERPKDGFVYFLRVGGYVKIGWTSDLEKRMRQYMPDSQLLAVKPGTRKDENALHRKFAHLKTHGREWFPLAPQITEEAERIVKEHGAPPVVDFSARRAQRIVGPRLNTGGPKPRTWVR